MGAEILISGASVAGPVLAYWLRRRGFTPVVVERTPQLRGGSGGHAVDLFDAAAEVVDRMGLWGEVREARTRTSVLTVERPGRRPVHLDVAALAEGSGERHVEVMRGTLAEILHQRTRDDVEYVFGDSVATLHQDEHGVDVTFEHGPPRRVAMVVGADGLHSTVRRLVFGAEEGFLHFLGGHLAVFTVPNHRGLDGQMVTHTPVGRLVGLYPVGEGLARALFLFRSAEPLRVDHRDREQQKRLLREVFAGDGWEVPRLLAEMDRADDFYLDSISQVRMDTWSRGRVTLVGDAAYSPGPAVGGGTTMAVVGAYVLAAQLAAAGGDPRVAFPACERALRDYVVRSRDVGPAVMRRIVPRSRLDAEVTALVLRLLPKVPALRRRLLESGSRPARVLSAIDLPDYEPSA